MGTGTTIKTGGGSGKRSNSSGTAGGSAGRTSYYNKNQNSFSYGRVLNINPDDKSIVYTPMEDRVGSGGEKKGIAYPFFGNNQQVPSEENIVPLVIGPARFIDTDPINQSDITTYYLDPISFQGTVNDNTTGDGNNTKPTENSYTNSTMGFTGPANYKVGPINKDVKSFRDVTIAVILNLEGGYYHPNMLKDGRVKDKRYGSSGETLFGLDRIAGGPAISSCGPCKQFWGLIDQNGASNKWEWNYIPPDPLKTQLLDLAAQIMEGEFNKNVKSYLPEKEILDVIKSDGRLLFNFIYATWNGPGWFHGFVKEIRKAYKSGVTDSGDLTALFIRKRTNNVGVIGNKKNNSLIAQGGKTISQIVGVA